MADEKRSFDPAETETNQGQRELDQQGSPTANAPALAGVSENPEEDWGEPAEGAAYSANHATRGEKTDAQRGPGPKTRKATKDAISRRV